ncbi:MAG: hypothetical protein ACXVZQ_02055 [Terriglobales bacterium]
MTRTRHIRRCKTRDQERGVALFLTIFALLLLSAVAIAMLFSSDTETTISINYRDKQGAIFAALGGLQEARDRIHPLTGDLGPGTNLASGGLNVVPTALPASSSPNILYILNPAPGETVVPWDPNNAYFDSELCQESYIVAHLSVTAGTAGVPCSATSASVPSGSSWYTWYNNSTKQTKSGAHATGGAAPMSTAYQLTDSSGNQIPLNYKWVRIQLKADNMTPVTVGTGNGTQVCWNGSHENQLPTGYNTDCTPPGGTVTNVTVTAPGSGYTSAPTISFSGGPGSGATATATLYQLPTGVTSVTLTNPGAGYTSPPAVTITPTDGNGSGAVVNAALNNTVPVQSVSWASAKPACYPIGSTPTVSFSPAGATATAVMTGQTCIYSITASGSCTTKSVTAAVTATNGTGTVAFAGSVTSGSNKKADGSYTPSNPGNYSTKPTTFSVASPCSAVTITPTYGVQLSSVTVNSGGAYQVGSPPSVSLSGSSPVGGTPAASATLAASGAAGALVSLTIPAGGSGSGYTANPILTIAPPCTPLAACGGVQATGTASISPSFGVSGVTITNGGSGYSQRNPPNVVFSGGGGSGASASATVGSGGNYMGQVYLLTSLAVTPTGARSMMQAETAVTYNQFTLGLGGALTLIGPNPLFGTPNSMPFQMIGSDCPTCAPAPPSCNTTAHAATDAIGVYDPTAATNPSAVQTVIGDLAKPNNYIGANSAPDVHNANLGNMTAADLSSFVSAVTSVATNTYGSNPSSINLGSAANPAIDVVNGDYSMGPTTGYGILVVTGTLSFSGDYAWNGLILVIGAGASVMSGGGHGQISGAVFVANTTGGSLSAPNVNWNGGGGNGIQYDHCWADDMLAKVPYTPVMSPSGLQIVSVRPLVY